MSQMNIQELVRILTLTLPILIPGLTFIIVLKSKKLRFLDIPIDLKISLGGKRIFGDNKTIKGVAVMAAMGIIVIYALNLGFKSHLNSFIHPVFNNQPVFVSLIYSVSYTVGELINSFFKRRLGIPPGQSKPNHRNLQTFFDLSDGILVAIIALITFTSVSLYEALIAGFIGIFIHYCTDILMKKLSLK